MCGIVGYVGTKKATDVLLSGLRRLEYRGYDSAGVAVLDQGSLRVVRSVGHVKRLAERLADHPLDGSLGIAHTRWATHGRPSELNAHPHVDFSSKFALVHNGVIENHSVLRTFLEQQGIKFYSETDTEVLVQLIGYFYSTTPDVTASLRNVLREVRGTFGLAILCADTPNTLFAARRGCPLIVGAGRDEYVVSSDTSAIVGHATQITYGPSHKRCPVG